MLGDPEHKHYGLKTLPNVNYLAKVTHGSHSKESIMTLTENDT